MIHDCKKAPSETRALVLAAILGFIRQLPCYYSILTADRASTSDLSARDIEQISEDAEVTLGCATNEAMGEQSSEGAALSQCLLRGLQIEDERSVVYAC